MAQNVAASDSEPLSDGDIFKFKTRTTRMSGSPFASLVPAPESEFDSGDDLFEGIEHETIPTLPVSRSLAPPSLTFADMKAQLSSSSSPAPVHVTQPTQILDTPVAAQKNRAGSVVQVAASSPIPYHASSPARGSPAPNSRPRQAVASSMAPPGTFFRRPNGVQQRPAAIPLVDIFSDDDPPVAHSSDSEGGEGAAAAPSRANIKPSIFTNGGNKPQTQRKADDASSQSSAADFSQIAQKFAYRSASGGDKSESGVTVPQKRMADDMASAYGSSSRDRKKTAKPVRQTGPARAMPVDADISFDQIPGYDMRKKVVELSQRFPNKSLQFLHDLLLQHRGRYESALAALVAKEQFTLDSIPDFSVRKTVERMHAIFPQHPIRFLYGTLVKKRGNFDDALAVIADAPEPKMKTNGASIDLTGSEDELAITRTTTLPRTTAKQEIKNNKSIREKWSSTRAAPKIQDVSQSQPVQKPRRRLVQGRKIPRQLSSSPVPEDPVDVVTIDSDSDSGVSSQAEDQSDFDTRLLKFFNTCSVPDLTDLSCQTEDVANAVIAQRPFKTLDDVRGVTTANQPTTAKGKRGGSRGKRVGERVVDVCEEMFTGYDAVDELVARCESLGTPIAATMKKWGFDVHGEARNGELGIVSLDDGDTTRSARDSGIGTPATSSPAPDDEDVVTKGKAPRQGNEDAGSGLLKQPTSMSEELVMKDYQIVGLNWLNLLWSKGLSCILADDMGLGKTCQVIAFLTHLCQSGESAGPHMIIVPGSTLENWLREFRNFSPSVAVEPYYGNQKERREQAVMIEDNIESINVIISTYDCATKKEDGKFLRHLQPVVCVYDEGHMLKNSATDRYKKLMRIPAQFRLLLTGTPLQNNLQELTSLLAFIMPDMFVEREEDLKYVFKHKAKTSDLDHAALLSAQRIAKARSMMTPFILRRKKHQVMKHMPEKTTRVEYCDLTASQRELYEHYLAMQKQALLDAAAGKYSKERTNWMMQLRKAAIHPLLFRRLYTDDTIAQMTRAIMREPSMADRNAEFVREDMAQHSDYECHQLCRKYPDTLSRFALTDDAWLDSGKVTKLAELLTGFAAAGHRTLVFSQFTAALDLLEPVLERLGLNFFRLDGDTPIPRRQDMLDAFSRDEAVPVFMLSTRSGGTGINLAAANRVVIFDSSFNPHDDVQAENRAHRVGQTRPVEVVRLVSRGTVEEQILQLGRSKIVLDERVAGEVAGGGAATKAGEEGVERKGQEEVERMMLEELGEGVTGGAMDDGKSDLKNEFMDGLKAAGLDLSAAA